MEFSQKLISLREEKNIDYNALSKGTGIPVERLKKFEKGAYKPSSKELYNLSLFYHISVESFYADPIVSDYYARSSTVKKVTICKFVIYIIFLLLILCPIAFYGKGQLRPDGVVDEVACFTSVYKTLPVALNVIVIGYLLLDLVYGIYILIGYPKASEKAAKNLRLIDYLTFLGGFGLMCIYNLNVYFNSIVTINRG